MTDGDRLLRAILERPDDDLVRLVYADWLEEQGHGYEAVIREGIRDPKVTRTLGVSLEPEFPTVPIDYEWRRGFVEAVHLKLTHFTESMARCLFSRHPITRVVLRQDWYVPPHLFDLLEQEAVNETKFYISPDAASTALSDACVAWGRSLAQLQPLPRTP